MAETFNRLNRFQFHNVGISHFGTNHSSLVTNGKLVFHFGIDIKIVAVFISEQKASRRYSRNSTGYTVVLVKGACQHFGYGSINHL